MQACAVTVIEVGDEAGEKIGQLAAQLQEQGYTVQTVSVSATDPAPAAVEQPAAPTDGEALPVAGEPAPTPPAAQTAEPAAHDNAQPFKCPACGATYPTATICSNGHDPVATLATSDVLAGATVADAAPADAGAATSPESGAASPSPAADPAAAPAPEEPAPEAEGGADPSGPAWPQ